LKQRILTAIVAAALVLVALWAPTPWPWWILAVVVSGLAGSELARLLQSPALTLVAPLAVGALVFRSEELPEGVFRAGISILALVWIACIALLALRMRVANSTERLIFGGVYLSVPLGLLAWAISLDLPGAWKAPLLVLLPLWAGDTAAIFAGRAFGRRPLAPEISPKKTVEGSLANLAACVGIALAVGTACGLGWMSSVGIGLATGILGQAGDLFESALKRQAGAKDSGGLLPGHGGVLDRIDSLLFAAPVVIWILAASA